MLPLFAGYVPSVPNALLALNIQIVAFGLLGAALFAYSRQRYHPRHVFIAIAVGIGVGWIGGLGYQLWPFVWQAKNVADVWRPFSAWLLLAYIELHWSTLSMFFGLLASWMSLEIVGPFVFRRASNTTESEA